MKPIIVRENRDGQVMLTTEELRKIIDEAYEEGKKDGTVTKVTYPYWLYKPYEPYNPYKTVTWDKTTL